MVQRLANYKPDLNGNSTSKRWQEDVEMEEEAGNWEKTKAELFDHQSSALFLGEILIIVVDTVVS